MNTEITVDYTGRPPCIMCGAKRGEPCTVISGGPGFGSPGEPRKYPHGQRATASEAGTVYDPGDRFVAVKDEPNHYRGEPHTAECGPDCPLPPHQEA